MAHPSPAEAIGTYIHAKDGNRPHLIAHAFAETAEVAIESRTGAIAFPPLLRGRKAIEDALVRRFAEGFENVYTFCLSDPPADDVMRFTCRWLVGMSERGTGAVRVGHGRYDWVFQDGPARRVERLTIAIDGMETMPPADGPAVLRWIAGLSYPWCAADAAIGAAPPVAMLATMLRAIGGRP